MFCRALLMSTSTSTHSTAISVPMPISSAYPWASPRQWMPAHAGWTNFEGFYNYNIVRYVPNVLAYLHVSPYGVHSGCIHEENHDPADFNEAEIVKMAVKYRDTIRGLKVRMCTATLGDYGIALSSGQWKFAGRIEQATGASVWWMFTTTTFPKMSQFRKSWRPCAQVMSFPT